MKRSLFPTSVVTKAFTWAYQELGLNVKQASEILGISPSSLAHLLISLSDGDSEQMKVWFRSYNVSFEMSPCDMCKQHDGIESVADQLRTLKQSSQDRESALTVVEFPYKERETRAGSTIH